ncbi:MAG: D-glycero-beta-D-manno-heptose 1-phosphate adenylyltransferase [Cyclobacteriaceae bacterium]
MLKRLNQMSNAIIEQVKEWKKQGMTIVFTNGCFDLLHAGHIDNLNAAKGFGDKLVVGLNSDSSVKRIKGSERPIMGENDRLKVMRALEMVDAALLFEEDTPEHLIGQILPDVLVKGNDYKIDNIAGAKIVKDHGGRVELVPLTKGRSTSRLIEQLKS